MPRDDRSPGWGAPRRLGLFLLVSLALHAGLLSVAPGRTGATSRAALPRTLAVYLEGGDAARPPRPAPHAQTATPAPAHKHSAEQANQAHGETRPSPEASTPAQSGSVPRTVRRPAPARHRASANRPQRTAHRSPAHTAEPAAVHTRAPTGSAPLPASVLASGARGVAQRPTPDAPAVAALLRRALKRHFRYPPLALQNAWQGRVVLHVRVASNGWVSEARVVHGSGFRVLDRAARRTAKAIGRLPAARPLLAGQALSFQVPVDYRLRPE